MNDKTRIYRVRCISGVVSTDDIIPGRYKHMYTDPAKLAQHVFENRFPGLAETFQPGDIIVATDTFGIGSSREQAVSSLIAAGVRAIFAPRFGRIFFRNSWNLGLLAIEVEAHDFQEGDRVELDVKGGQAISSSGKALFSPPPTKILEMVAAGGLLAQIEAKIGTEATPTPRDGGLR